MEKKKNKPHLAPVPSPEPIETPRAEAVKILNVVPEDGPRIMVFAPPVVSLATKQEYMIAFDLAGRRVGFMIEANNAKHASVIGGYYASGFVAGLSVKLDQPPEEAGGEEAEVIEPETTEEKTK